MSQRDVFHEALDRKHDVKASSDRSFGFVLASVFALIALWPLLWRGEMPRLWASIVALLFVLLAFFVPRLLGPFNRIWLRFGGAIGRVSQVIILGFIFYGVITPYGFVIRLFGGDLLRLKRDLDTQSYWIDRDPPGPEPESLKQQF